LGDKALQKKITETRENKEVYKFWTRSKTNLLKGKKIRKFTNFGQGVKQIS